MQCGTSRMRTMVPSQLDAPIGEAAAGAAMAHIMATAAKAAKSVLLEGMPVSICIFGFNCCCVTLCCCELL